MHNEYANLNVINEELNKLKKHNKITEWKIGSGSGMSELHLKAADLRSHPQTLYWVWCVCISSVFTARCKDSALNYAFL
jgi:hypothetical protein